MISRNGVKRPTYLQNIIILILLRTSYGLLNPSKSIVNRIRSPRSQYLSNTNTTQCSSKAHDHEASEQRIKNRRDFLRPIVLGLSLSLPVPGIRPNSVSAITPLEQSLPTTKKPFAPNEALLPAARVKLAIYRGTSLGKSLVDAIKDPSSQPPDVALHGLSDMFLKPQNYTRIIPRMDVPSRPAARYLESYKSMDGDIPLQSYFIKSGDISAWKRLKREERAKEQVDPVRAALNTYTDALSFSGDEYLLNVDKATRSDMVRGDRLPGVKQVITSDMGLRYLYRNQVLTAVEDFRAELEYQSKHSEELDGEELVRLLAEADTALERWFSLIDPDDVKLAFETALMENS